MRSWGAETSTDIKRFAFMLCGFTLLTTALFWPFLVHLSSALIGPPEDNMQDFWNSWHAVTAPGWRDFFFTRQIRFPEGAPLYYHSFAYPQILAVVLLSKIFGTAFPTLVTLQNLTLLSSFPLSALSMFYLTRYLLAEGQGRTFAAALGGFIFAFNPWHVAQVMHHAHVATIEFLPLFVLFYLMALQLRSLAWLAAAALAQALSALSCWYFLFYALYFMGFHLLALRLRDRRWPRGWSLLAPLLSTAGALLLLAPWLIPMVAAALKGSVSYVGNDMFDADALAFVAFPPTHFLAAYGAQVYAALTGNAWEDTVYLGLVNLAVLVWALTRGRNDQPKGLIYYALGGMLFFAVIAGGEALHIGGHITPIALPGVVLAKLPLLSNVRTPSRAMVMVYLFLGVALAQIAGAAWHNRAWRPAMTLLLALGLLDFTPVHLAVTPAVCPPVLDSVAKDPEAGFAVLDLPSGYVEGNAYMMLSACHGHPIVQGETARKVNTTLADRLETRDLAAQKRLLIADHVKYLVIHDRQGPLFFWNAQDGDAKQYYAIYRKVGAGNGMTVLQVY